ncbi:uncharacterized protein BT62DRAFT_339540 [Guyanagaster necrorhizus]|uniref:Uncharacterized protein n=1 Tax=Guyanagaster necrorhizus TaxID=856835 RepID=A0A9P7VMF5_9AGAR|nr:uncharacterized protein BT62DRAFT_339540 [Guyanagaster necrorhizus MCA 3950]KAG7443297.1 hypothetical protein BT62DRAFT_339540 [Guyanagaster necrorhizus MCA 3950]
MWSKVTGERDESQARIDKEERYLIQSYGFISPCSSNMRSTSKQNVEMLELIIAEATAVKEERSENLDKYTSLHTELQVMYSSLSDGRTDGESINVHCIRKA